MPSANPTTSSSEAAHIESITMTEQSVLVVTVGRSDIKIRLLDKNGNSDIYEIQSESTRHFHHLLRSTLASEAHRLHYAPSSPTQQESPKSDSARTPKAKCRQDGTFWFKDRDKDHELGLPDGRLELNFPKLATPVAMLGQEEVRQPGLIKGALVYYTDRSALELNEEEPFAAGEIVQHWLADQLRLDVAPSGSTWQAGAVCRINYAKGKAAIEGAGRDYPLYRSICALLEAPLRQARQEFPNARLDLCTLGGMKTVNTILYASARMFFARVRPLNTSERHIAADELAFADQALAAEENYLLRAQAIVLLRHNHIASAHTLVTTRLNATSGEQVSWLHTLGHVHQLLQGQWRPSAYPHAGPLHQRLLAHGLHYCPRTLVLLLRVDAALKQGQLPAAMQLSLALPQAALLDGIARFVQCQVQQERLENPLQRYWAMADEADCINAKNQCLELHHIRNPALRKRIYDRLPKTAMASGKTVPASDTLPTTSRSLDGLWKDWPQPFDYSQAGEAWLTFVDEETLRQYPLESTRSNTLEPLRPALDKLCCALRPHAQTLYAHSLRHNAYAWSNAGSTPLPRLLAKPWLEAGIWEPEPSGNDERDLNATDLAACQWRLARPLLLPVLQALGYGQEPPSTAELIDICIIPLYASVMD